MRPQQSWAQEQHSKAMFLIYFSACSFRDPKPDWGETSYKGSGKMKGHVALITGGDSGIGRAVAIAFGREGADVAISYLPQEQADAEECKRMVEQSGTKCILLPGDLADKDHCSKIVEDTVAQLGKITCLVWTQETRQCEGWYLLCWDSHPSSLSLVLSHSLSCFDTSLFSVQVNNAAYQGKAVSGLDELSYERVLTTFKVRPATTHRDDISPMMRKQVLFGVVSQLTCPRELLLSSGEHRFLLRSEQSGHQAHEAGQHDHQYRIHSSL
jgi:NAD(P)-dependent dehydrogenase (short-subunit alcohol dehydrogenase family)